MAVDTFVQVAADGSGKKIRNVSHDIGGHTVHQQVTAIADPENGVDVARVVASLPTADAPGVVVRDPAPSYDSGITNLPDTLSVVTAETIVATGILLCNRTTTSKGIDLTNSSGDYYLKEFPLQGKQTVFIPLGRVQMVGVKWKASDADSVNAQLVGEL